MKLHFVLLSLLTAFALLALVGFKAPSPSDITGKKVLDTPQKLCERAPSDEKEKCLKVLSDTQAAISSDDWKALSVCLSKNDVIAKEQFKACVDSDLRDKIMAYMMKETEKEATSEVPSSGAAADLAARTAETVLICAKAQEKEGEKCESGLKAAAEVFTAPLWEELTSCLKKAESIDKEAFMSCVTDDMTKEMKMDKRVGDHTGPKSSADLAHVLITICSKTEEGKVEECLEGLSIAKKALAASQWEKFTACLGGFEKISSDVAKGCMDSEMETQIKKARSSSDH